MSPKSDPRAVLGMLAPEADVVCHFLGLFSRFEYALKRAGYLTKNQTMAEANWDDYANSLRGKLTSVKHQAFVDAITFLRKAPPRKQIVTRRALTWADNPPGAGEHDENYILRLVRTVRNNLFHGGKYSFGPVPDAARDRELLEASITVLTHCLDLNADIQAAFDEVG